MNPNFNLLFYWYFDQDCFQSQSSQTEQKNNKTLLHPHKLQSVWSAADSDLWPPRKLTHFCTLQNITEDLSSRRFNPPLENQNKAPHVSPSSRAGSNKLILLSLSLITSVSQFYRVISDVDAQAEFSLAQMEADISVSSSLLLISPPELELCGQFLLLWIKKYKLLVYWSFRCNRSQWRCWFFWLSWE